MVDEQVIDEGQLSVLLDLFVFNTDTRNGLGGQMMGWMILPNFCKRRVHSPTKSGLSFNKDYKNQMADVSSLQFN